MRFRRSSSIAARAWLIAATALVPLAADLGHAQSEDESADGRGRPRKRLKLSGEVKLNLRHSEEESFRLATVVPPDFLRPGETSLFLRTPDPGWSPEVSDVSVTADLTVSPAIKARVKVHALDLYNRNPTATGDRLFVRQAWARFGKRHDTLRPSPGSSLYLQFGLAPRFTKQVRRHLESYGLWGTAFGRLELMQLQLGGSIGKHLYFRAHAASRNPVFFRDPNALAGDNGTDRRVPGDNDPEFESGVPILYDTLPSDVNFDGAHELGAGLGLRLVDGDTRNGVDLLAWYFRGELQDAVPLRGTFYEGDLDLFTAAGQALPFRGDDKTERGVTVQARLGRVRLYGQYTDQDIAELGRRGFEVEAVYRAPLGGLFVSGDQPVLNWLQFAFRFSNIDNRFSMPAGFVAPSVGWDWRKYDFGVRLGIVRNMDLTVEYARHDMITARETIHPDEALLTLRIGLE